MLAIPADGDVSRAVGLRTRLSHRLARLVPASPVNLSLETPLVSFTFDDAPVCACTVGADLLEAYDAKGTFYIAGGLLGEHTPHWRVADDALIAALHGRGHEIGDHTYSHVFVPNFSGEALEAEADRNRQRLRAIVPGLELESFAFPYGFGTVSAKRKLARRFRSSRSIVPGLNVGRTDLHFLRANPLIDSLTDADHVGRLMDEAVARKAWLIFYGHDVVEDPSPYGCSPALLQAALDAASRRGIPCMSVAEALRRAA